MEGNARFRWRFSMHEAAVWMTGFAVSLATPYWFGPYSLTVFFYGTLAALTWRLSANTSFAIAFALAIAAATLITICMLLLFSEKIL